MYTSKMYDSTFIDYGAFITCCGSKLTICRSNNRTKDHFTAKSKTMLQQALWRILRLRKNEQLASSVISLL